MLASPKCLHPLALSGDLLPSAREILCTGSARWEHYEPATLLFWGFCLLTHHALESIAVNDEQLIAAFENCSLRNEDFHHADHVRMAFLYLSRFPILDALQRFSESLQRFAKSKGKPNLYHETVTWAFLFLIRERLAMQSSRQDGRQPTWNDFAAQNRDLLYQKSSVILRDYYIDETLQSELAKKIFILPNPGLSGQRRRGGQSAIICS